MNKRSLAAIAALSLAAFSATIAVAQTAPAVRNEPGPYARIAMFHPLDGHNVDFEASYIRHLDWHREAKDPWTWYGYTIHYSDRRYWFIYATFGHAAADFDQPVDPVGDDLHNTMHVMPHVEHWKNAFYEFLPAISKGASETGVPTPNLRVEFITVELKPGAEKAFEAALAADKSALKDETLWYRQVSGGSAPRYLRLRPYKSFAAALEGAEQQTLPDKANNLVDDLTVEIVSLRPNMSYNLPAAR
jgi:hypothetical protein